MALKGMAMGIAEVIPGVSGGTIAFITGIYETLINAIKSVDGKLLSLVRRANWAGAWQHINGTFLLNLFVGMAAGVGIGVFGITHLLETAPEPLWGFFFGLIVASAIYIGKQVYRWSPGRIGICLIGAVVAFGITLISPAEGSSNLFYVFICGAIAISALILPGISGSFMLLLLGMYTVIIPSVKEFLSSFDLSLVPMLAVFGIGCLVGLGTFSRVLSWMFKKYRGETFALLTGFMIGSLNKIWPWRLPVEWIDDSGNRIADAVAANAHSADELRVVVEKNALPGDYADPQTMVVVVAAIAGFAIVFLLERFGGD